MINEKELMIGNWVFIKGIPSKVAMFSNSIISNQKDYNLLSKLEDAEPIPITEKTLLDCGFQLFPWGFAIENNPLIRFSKTPNEKYWIELGNGFRIELPYLHTLQNLISLTGKELIYNPK